MRKYYRKCERGQEIKKEEKERNILNPSVKSIDIKAYCWTEAITELKRSSGRARRRVTRLRASENYMELIDA